MSNIRSWAGFAAGIGFLIEGVLVLGHPQGDSGWGATGRTVEAAFVVGLLGALNALPFVRDRLAPSRTARVGVRIAEAGFALLAAASLASLVAGKNVLGLVFVIGLLATLAGLVVFALAGGRAGGRGWLTAVPFAAMVVGIAFGDSGGSIVLGVAWLALTAVLTRRRAGVAATA